MDGHRGGLRERTKELFASSGLATIRSRQVPQDEIWVVEHLTLEGDKTTSGGNTRARVYIDTHGDKLYLTEQDAPAADTLYELHDPFRLYQGERIAAEWDQAQAATTLILVVVGQRLFAPEG